MQGGIRGKSYLFHSAPSMIIKVLQHAWLAVCSGGCHRLACPSRYGDKSRGYDYHSKYWGVSTYLKLVTDLVNYSMILSEYLLYRRD
jgi:hypothetical protein